MLIDRFVNRKSLFSAVIIIIITVLSYFPVFNNLGKFQIRMWDEASYANNSIDMLLTNQNIFVVEKQGKPDLYNTKPPFVIWLQALSMKWNLSLIKMILAVAAILFLIKPYKEILRSLKYPEEDIYSMEFDGAYLKYLKINRPDIKSLTVYKKEHNDALYDQVLFYIRAYEQQNNYHIRLTQEMNFQKDEIVMVCKQEDQEKIRDHYSVKELNRWKAGNLYQILKRNYLSSY